MNLDKEQILQIAVLARLQLKEEKLNMYIEQLSTVFQYVDMLAQVNTEGVDETTQVTGLQDVVREDIVVDSSEEKRKKLIALFPEKVGDLLKVDAVFENVD
ncbi:MAG: Asp-tRNA(Asn)/Glu-tRNA(Gln) amidotransferase subunit GatC [Candidatus Magasanikbacteria bacterium]